MDNYIIAEINEFSQKENGYLALFCVRLGNFCVKADPQAMLSATIHLESAEYNFEDVADATRPNDYTFDVTPKNENNLSAIIQGVAEVHPEFKVSVKIKEYDEGFEERHIIYTMPEVNKERRDLLNEVCKTFHKECVAKLDWAYGKRLADTAQLLARLSVQEADNVKKVFEKTYHDAKENAEKLLNAKLQEIEEGYQRYLAGKDNTWENSYKDDTEFDVSSLI
jgi:hypothetical protein